MTELVQMISTVGFPIVMCLLMWYMNEKQDVRHQEEVDKMTEAVNNNTLALQQVLDALRKE